MMEYCLLDPKEQISVKFNRNSNIFIQENAFENVVCEMASIFLGLDELYNYVATRADILNANTSLLQVCLNVITRINVIRANTRMHQSYTYFLLGEIDVIRMDIFFQGNILYRDVLIEISTIVYQPVLSCVLLTGLH